MNTKINRRVYRVFTKEIAEKGRVFHKDLKKIFVVSDFSNLFGLNSVLVVL